MSRPYAGYPVRQKEIDVKEISEEEFMRAQTEKMAREAQENGSGAPPEAEPIPAPRPARLPQPTYPAAPRLPQPRPEPSLPVSGLLKLVGYALGGHALMWVNLGVAGTLFGVAVTDPQPLKLVAAAGYAVLIYIPMLFKGVR